MTVRMGHLLRATTDPTGHLDRRHVARAATSLHAPLTRPRRPRSCREAFDHLPYALRRSARVFVLPDPRHVPPKRFKALVRIGIPRPVEVDLPCPPVAVAAWSKVVLRTPVPEAAIDEYGQALASERDVDRATRQTLNAQLDTKSTSAGVEFSAQGQFGTVPARAKPANFWLMICRGARRGGSCAMARPSSRHDARSLDTRPRKRQVKAPPVEPIGKYPTQELRCSSRVPNLVPCGSLTWA